MRWLVTGLCVSKSVRLLAGSYFNNAGAQLIITFNMYEGTVDDGDRGSVIYQIPHK